jgi:hypothetical protein
VNDFSSRLNTKVSVGKIDYKLFNTIALKDVYIADEQGDTLLYSHVSRAHFRFWKLLSGNFSFKSVSFDGLYGNLKIDKKGHSNLDFIIKELQSNSKKPSNISYQINQFGLHNCTFRFTDQRQSTPSLKGIFNPGKLCFSQINAEIILKKLKKDTLNAEINSLSAVEQSGFTLTNFSTKIAGTSHGVRIPFIDLRLPQSRINLEDISLKVDSLSDLKDFTNKVRIQAHILESNLALSDLKCFVPEFSKTRGVATLSGIINGRVSNLRFQKMEIKYGKTFRLNADLDINGLPNVADAFIYGKINELKVEKYDLQDIVSDFTHRPFLLPNELNQLGLVHYKGNITGFLGNLVVYGNLNTNLGSISTDILLQLENQLRDLKYNGTIKTTNFQLGKLLASKQVGNVSFQLNTQGSKKYEKPLQGIIDAKVPELQYNNYSYRDIQFKGKYDGTGFDGNIDVKDDNITASFKGIIDLTQKLPIYDFNLNLKNTNLYALHLINSYPDANLSFVGKTNMVGNSFDNINGFVRFDSIQFRNAGKVLNVDQLYFASRINGDVTRFIVQSDFVNGSLSGDFNYSSLGQTFSRVIADYLPSLGASKIDSKNHLSNQVNVDLEFQPLTQLFEVFQLPYEMSGVSTLKGKVDDGTHQLVLEANIPSFKSNKLNFENLTFRAENPNKKLQITSRGLLQGQDDTYSLFLHSTAADDQLSTQMGWQNSREITNAGEIQSLMNFKNINGKTDTHLTLLPTQVIIADSVWNIHRCNIDFNSDSTIHVQNFLFDCNRQFIHADGLASSRKTDSLQVEMNDISLSFIFNLLKLKGIHIDGMATGKATLKSILKAPIFEAGIAVKDFTLNFKPIADANIVATWDKVHQHVLGKVIFTDKQQHLVAIGTGFFDPKADSLDFSFDLRKLNVAFLDPYLSSIVQNFKGEGSGNIRMVGPTKKIVFEGDAFIKNGQASVKLLNTSYTFNDSVHLLQKEIVLKNISIYDQERNRATLSGIMAHDGIFKDMKYDVNIRSNNFLALDTHAENNDYFFGKAYANGTVHIFGDEKEANIFVNAVSQPRTKCYIQMGGASKASDNSFITFVNNRVYATQTQLSEPKPESAFDVKVNLQIEVTPNADMELIVDPKAGDMITGNGNGNLRVEFDTFSNIKLYGTYIIDNGYYLFTMQNLFRKEFKIDQGSTISWTGDPFKAQVNIRALYPLTVSLKDLAGNQVSNNMRSTVPVNCVLKLTDNLMKPTIKFDIDLPQSDEGVKQLVKNIVNTDEMMNRQILYLLVFNKFYTPDYMRTNTTNTNFATNEGLSLLTSTASAQINSWLSQMVNNVTVGLDYQQSNQTSSNEYQAQAQILYQPNNRLIVNGNFGYRIDNLSNSTNRFIGDVDLEYLLTESGKLRFKAYNHTVDRYYLGSAKLSQGLGFVYKEDFATVDDLLKYYWHLLSGNKNKKNNETKKK